jgi:hypothetical protein
MFKKMLTAAIVLGSVTGLASALTPDENAGQRGPEIQAGAPGPEVANRHVEYEYKYGPFPNTEYARGFMDWASEHFPPDEFSAIALDDTNKSAQYVITTWTDTQGQDIYYGQMWRKIYMSVHTWED